MVGQSGAFKGVCGRSRGRYFKTNIRKRRRSNATSLGIIEVIHAVSIRISANHWREILSITPQQEMDEADHLGKKLKPSKEKIAFDDDDLEGTTQPHGDVLVVTLKIGVFLLKRVMINQGSRAKIMYPDLYKGLDLRDEDLTKYDTPLVRFDEKWWCQRVRSSSL